MKKQLLFVITTLFLAAIFMFGTFGLATSAGIATTPTPNPYPTSASPRQGVSPYYFNSQNNLSKLGTWMALWSPYAGAYTTAFQIIPMASWSQDLPSTSTVQYIDGQTPNYNYWLVFNECEQIGQCDKPPAVQAQFYHDQVLPLMQVSDPDAKLIIGGSTSHECGLNWMTNFVQAYHSLYPTEPLTRAGWHFHIYPNIKPRNWQPGQPCPTRWNSDAVLATATITSYISDVERVRVWWSLYGSPSDEIWVTETGCLGTGCPVTDTLTHPNMVDFMSSVTAYLNDQGRWIDRYSWYTNYDGTDSHPHPFSWLTTDPNNAQFTAIGDYYSLIHPSAHVAGFLAYHAYLPSVLSNDAAGSGLIEMSGISPFASPLPAPSGVTFDSPIPIPSPDLQ